MSICEDYVTFETAKLLKEKGFDGECHFAFYKDGTIVDRYDSDFSHIHYDRPTLQMAMKWLRKEHNLHCSSDYDIVFGWYCQITNLTETIEEHYKEMKHYRPDKDSGFSSPEEACEAAIKYCLENLI